MQCYRKIYIKINVLQLIAIFIPGGAQWVRLTNFWRVGRYKAQ
jgi:hypothetical protein